MYTVLSFRPVHRRNIPIWFDGDCVNLHLSSDSSARISTHTNELIARSGILIFVWVIVTITWLLNIDRLLEIFVAMFNPCSGDCLNLYNPEKWSELRWIVAGFLGLVCMVPIINLQIWSFSKPALTSSERRMLRLVLILAPLLFLLSSYVTIAELLPKFYLIGHDIHSDYGFVAKYDAVSLIYFAMTILWIQTLVIVSSSVMICGGLTGNLDSSNANWWRLRVYGFTSLVSILSHYDKTTNGLLITLLTILLVELISRPWTSKKPKYDVILQNSFTTDGEIISTINLLCGCIEGYSPGKDQYLSIPNICKNLTAQEDFIKILANKKPHKVNIYCCNNTTVWNNLASISHDLEIIINSDNSAA